MLYVYATILSIIQSLTEFLPVSSSGHLLLIGRLLKINQDIFEIINLTTQISTVFTVIFFFRKKLLNILFTINNKDSINFINKFIIAFLPSVIFGFLFYKNIKYINNNIYTMPFCLIFLGIVFLFLDKFITNRYDSIENVSFLTSFKIGFSQILSFFSGVSRSGITITSGLFCGLTKKNAIEFSFILSIPTTLIACSYSIYKNYKLFISADFYLISFVFILTFILSSFTINFFFKYIEEHSLKIFGLYRIILGILIFIINIL